MGSVINTKGDEKSPFIHTDSKTLYFSSNGHNGVGGMDIFYSQQQKNGRWNKPKNIGYPINSEGDDLGFIVSTNGEKAYFSSSRFDNSGGWDIYSFNLYKEARPHKVVFIKGKLVDESGQAITDAKVELKTSNGTTSSGMVDKKTGSYAVAVAVDDTKEKVVMVVKKKNGTFSAKAINTEEATKTPVKVKMQVHTLKTGTPFEIPDIQFATNSAVFDQESMFVLDNFVDYLKENSKLKIGIYGHTDNVGDPQKNLKLSQERAQSVRDYLVLMGVKSKRIVAVKGFGDTKPIASNNTAQGRAKNRRTEFIIMGK
jgi:outer membrane protein OmpA-like peptidoglycan-associated protein